MGTSPLRSAGKESAAYTRVRLPSEPESNREQQPSSSSGVNEDSGWVDIHSAAKANNLKVVQAQVNNDASARDTETACDESPLMIAALNGSFDVVEWLHKNGASLSVTAPNGNTTVHYSAASGCPCTLQYILAQEGIQLYVNSLNKMGDTPMHMAVSCGCSKTVRVLCHHGADLNLKNKHHQIPRDLAQALGHSACLRELQDTPSQHQPQPVAETTEEDTDGNLRRSDEPAPPTSLRNDQKQKFHQSVVERATLVGGNNTSNDRKRDDGSADHTKCSSQSEKSSLAPTPAQGGTGTETRQQEQCLGGGSKVPLAPLEAMKPKIRNELAQKDQNGEGAKWTPADDVYTGSSQPPLQQHPVTTTPNICPKCGQEKTPRSFTIGHAKEMIIGHTIVKDPTGVKYDETVCFFCTLRGMQGSNSPEEEKAVPSDDQISQRRGSGRERGEVRSQSTAEEERREEGQNRERGSKTVVVEKREEEQNWGRGRSDESTARRGSEGHQERWESGIDGGSMEGTDGPIPDEEPPHENLESGYFTLSYNSIPPGGKWGDGEGGREGRADSSGPVGFRRASIPKLVWLTSPLTQEGQYFGKRAVLRCSAEKLSSVRGKIRYQWYKKTPPSSEFYFYKETDCAVLTFDPLCPENNGYYFCQAEVTGEIDGSNEVCVRGRNEPPLEVVKQPRSWVLAEGATLRLHCQARLRDGGDRKSVSYQWFHNGTLLPGSTSSTYRRERVTLMDMGQYMCRVSDGRGCLIFTEPATVAPAYPDDTNSDSGPKSLHQIQQLRAQKIQQTADGTRYATDKVAFLLGNEAYRYHHELTSSVADVRAMKDALTKAGFKVFSLVNLTCDETMSALDLICERLEAGVYVMFAYTGHGCSLGTTDYIMPVDVHQSVTSSQCIAISTICNKLQLKLCRVFLIMNCCRSTPQGCNPVAADVHCCDYANWAILRASMKGQRAYEESRIITTALVDALKEDNSYKTVFNTVQNKMKSVHVADGTNSYPQPTTEYSSMDPDISFHDAIMLDDPELEEPLDKLHEMWRAANTPPVPVLLQPDMLGLDLNQLVEDVGLRFECDCCNILVVVIQWRVRSPDISCTVRMLDQGQGVDIERSSMKDCEAHFRISSLQRLSGNLRLQFQFSVTSHDHSEPRHFTLSHDLQSRPLFASLMIPHDSLQS